MNELDVEMRDYYERLLVREGNLKRFWHSQYYKLKRQMEAAIAWSEREKAQEFKERDSENWDDHIRDAMQKTEDVKDK